jgi:hypothetical protein
VAAVITSEERQRSPRYPSFTLEQALLAVEKIYVKDRRTATTRDVAAKHMGYAGITGSSSRMLGALNYYGLTEEAGQGRLRVSDLAQVLMHPKDQTERWERLNEALHNPKVFGTLLAKHTMDQMPSDETLKTELIREFQYNPDAAQDVVKTLKQSLAFLGPPPVPISDSLPANEVKDDTLLHRNSLRDSQNFNHANSAVVTGNPQAGEQKIEAKLSSNAHVEIRIKGAIGKNELKRLNRWLEEIVKPWAMFQVMDEDINDEA